MKNFEQVSSDLQESTNELNVNDCINSCNDSEKRVFVPCLYDYFNERELSCMLDALAPEVPFLNLSTYTGFKHLFGNSKNEDLTRRLLNELIKDRQIKKIEYFDEPTPDLILRKCLGEVYLRCKDGRGQYFFVLLINVFFEIRRNGYFLWAYMSAIRLLRKYGYEPGKTLKLPRVYVIEFLGSNVLEGDNLMTVSDRVHEPYLDEEISDGPTLAIEKVMTRFTFELPKVTDDYEKANGFFEKLCFCIRYAQSLESAQKDDDPFFKKLSEVSRLQKLEYFEVEDYLQEMLSRW